MSQSQSVSRNELTYVLAIVREYRAKAEAARRAAGTDDASFYQFAGEALAFARIEGHIEGMLSCNQIYAK